MYHHSTVNVSLYVICVCIQYFYISCKTYVVSIFTLLNLRRKDGFSGRNVGVKYNVNACSVKPYI